MAAHLVRLVALWILTGGLLKLLTGTPGDLPALIRDLPLETGLTFKLVIAVELGVGTLALLRPSVGWKPAMLLLLAFIGVLAVQLSAGDTSCRCFGAAANVSPALMLGLDLTMMGLLLLSRPWRLGQEVDLDTFLIVPLLICACAVPWLYSRQVTQPKQSGWLDVAIEKWEGERVRDLPIASWLGEHVDLKQGAIIIWRPSCPMCAEHLETLSHIENGFTGRELVLIELPDHPADAVEVHTMPTGPFVHHIKLDSKPVWAVTPPAHAEVQDGVVVSAKEGRKVLE